MIPNLDDRVIFQHDGAPYNRLRATQWNLVDEGIAVLKYWPVYSTDLYIIEKMRTELKRRVLQKNPRNFEELGKLRRREWYLIPVEMINYLLTFVPMCIKAVTLVYKNKFLV